MAEPLMPVPGAESLGEQQSAPQLPLRRLTPRDVASGEEALLRERKISFVEDQEAFKAFADELRAEAAVDTRQMSLPPSAVGRKH